MLYLHTGSAFQDFYQWSNPQGRGPRVRSPPQGCLSTGRASSTGQRSTGRASSTGVPVHRLGLLLKGLEVSVDSVQKSFRIVPLNLSNGVTRMYPQHFTCSQLLLTAAFHLCILNTFELNIHTAPHALKLFKVEWSVSMTSETPTAERS